MKPATACRQCRVAKRRCTREGSGLACKPCRERSLACGSADSRRRELLHARRAATSTAVSPQRPSFPSHDDASPDGELQYLVEVYMTKVHGQAHAIFHLPTLRGLLRNNSVSRTLLLAMAAIGSKFTSDPLRRGSRREFALEAKRLLLADMENICLENIQACILVAMLCAGGCNVSSEALFIRTAVSMAHIMKLDTVANDETCPVTTRETARLVCWTLYLVHHRCFSGLGPPGTNDGFRATCELPMDELDFASLAPGSDQARLESPRRLGLWARRVTLVQLLNPIMEHNRRIADGNVEPAEVNKTVKQIEARLQGWLASLPADIQMTVPNLDRQQQNGLGGLFVALHLTLHYYSMLLYFGFLEGRKHAPPSSVGDGVCPFADLCKHHASSFSGLLHLSRQLDSCQISYPGFSHMITVSSAVLLHTLLLGDAGEIRDARRNLNANFEALVELQQSWPATTAVIGRLMKFQRICLLSAESHRLDGWMVRFLLDHSIEIEDKYSSSAPSVPDVEGLMEAPQTRALREAGRYTDFQAV